MKLIPTHVLSIGLTAGVLAFSAPAAMAAGQCEITSHRASDGGIEVDVRNNDSEPQTATAWFEPNYAYPGPGVKADGIEIASASGVVEPNGQRTLMVQGRSSTSRLKQPMGVSLRCAPA